MRIRVFLAITFASLLLAVAPAHAKGADQATIAGEGLDAPIALTGVEGDGGSLATLAEQVGFYYGVFASQPDPMLDAAPTEDLGPRLVITWHMPSGVGTADEIRQDVYPWAAGGAVTYTPPGQPFFTTELTHGGWFRAGPGLVATLGQLGVPSRDAYEAAAAPPSTVAPRPAIGSTPSDDPSSIAWPLVGIIAGCIALAGTALLGRQMTRRRARTVPA
jgi:hypothetical protein